MEHLEFVGLGKEGGVDRHVIVGVEVGAAKSVGHRFLLGGNETWGIGRGCDQPWEEESVYGAEDSRSGIGLTVAIGELGCGSVVGGQTEWSGRRGPGVHRVPDAARAWLHFEAHSVVHAGHHESSVKVEAL